MKVAIGCDHAGIDMKQAIVKFLTDNKELELIDFGINEAESDYPDIAERVAAAIVSGEYERGILICGTGIGMSIAANKIKGIRAAACSEYYGAIYTRKHNNANILCLGARIIGEGVACGLADIFLSTDFDGGKHKRRVDMITRLEG